MDARFEMSNHESQKRPKLIVTPNAGLEALLLDVFIRYDANMFNIRVTRRENGEIESVAFESSYGE